MRNDAILVLDFGGQYCHLIARRVRDNNVYSEIVPNDIKLETIKALDKKFNVKGIILSGGPASIYEKDSPGMDRRILDLKIPILGICYGHQLIADYMDGKVKRSSRREFGMSTAQVDNKEAIFRGLEGHEQVWMSHGDKVIRVPSNFHVIASTDNCSVAAFRSNNGSIYGIQWHPEAVHTKNGHVIFRNFLFDICKCEPNWKVGNLVDGYIYDIKKEIGKENAIVALSGGVDSSAAAALASKALGSRLTAVFVDHGFMRQDEPEQIKLLAKKIGINLVHVDARDRFLKKLKGVRDPEAKRKAIGKEFIRVFEEVAKKTNAKYLVQGTIYPDRIESGHSKKSKVIKSHHNVGGLPTKIDFKGIVEPLRELYKDEVRKVARQLRLPDEIVNRQPFPGPGLAVRIMGQVTNAKLDLLRKADAIVTAEIEKAGLAEIWQYFAVLTDTQTTGVKGDSRSYGHVVAIRAVESKDAMSATFSKIPYVVLEDISTRITNEIPDVVRVVYDITNKPPSTVEWE